MKELCKPDERNLRHNGWSVEDLQTSLKQSMDALSNNVPQAVRDHLIVSQNLATYGWFQWEFYTVSLAWSLTSIEMALNQKFVETCKGQRFTIVRRGKIKTVIVDYGIFPELRKGWRIQGKPGFNGSFKSLIEWAKNEKMFRGTPIVLQELTILLQENKRCGDIRSSSPLDLIPDLRNQLIHMEQNLIFPPQSAINGLKQAVQVINRLWS